MNDRASGEGAQGGAQVSDSLVLRGKSSQASGSGGGVQAEDSHQLRTEQPLQASFGGAQAREFWKAKPLTAEEVAALPNEISQYIGPTGYWSKELLAAPLPNEERRSCRWGCNAHHYRSMKEASVHFIQQRSVGIYVPSCQKWRQKVDYRCQFILCDPECDIGRTNLHLYLRHHWYHEMKGDGAPCVCGRRFGDPDAAAYHLFWATGDCNTFDRRCRGEVESPTSLLTNSFRSSAVWTVNADDSGKTTGKYVLK